MRTLILSIVSATLVAAAPATGSAPEQTATPGQMTQARVWVQNHGASEAIPVDIRDTNVDSTHALRVRVVNGEASSGVFALRAQLTASVWDYRTIVVKGDQPARELAVPGAEGWETTGVAWPTADGTMLLLKRPR